MNTFKGTKLQLFFDIRKFLSNFFYPNAIFVPIWSLDGYQAVFFYRPYMVDALNHSSHNHKKEKHTAK